MYPILKTAVVAMAVLLLTIPSHADGATALDFGTLAVGSTGIYCYQAPCPWRGIIGSEDGGQPSWTGSALPAIQARAQERQLIIEAWDDFKCLLVDGAFDGATLTVNQVLGSCS